MLVVPSNQPCLIKLLITGEILYAHLMGFPDVVLLKGHCLKSIKQAPTHMGAGDPDLFQLLSAF